MKIEIIKVRLMRRESNWIMHPCFLGKKRQKLKYENRHLANMSLIYKGVGEREVGGDAFLKEVRRLE